MMLACPLPLVRTVACFVFAAAAAVAQEPEFWLPYSTGDHSGVITARRGKGTIAWSTRTPAFAERTVTSPCAEHFDAVHLGDAVFVVAGASAAGDALLVLVEISPPAVGTIRIASQVNLGSATTVDELHWSDADAGLFVFDRRRCRLWLAPMDPAQPALPEFADFVDATPEPPLPELQACTDLVPPASGIGCGLLVPMAGTEWRLLWDRIEVHRDAQGLWPHRKMPRPSSPAPATWEVRDSSYLTNTDPLWVRGAVGAFSVVNEWNGRVEVHGTTTEAEVFTAVPVPQGLVPGVRHLLTGSGARPAVFVPHVRHGSPTGDPAAVLPRGFVYAPFVAGNSDFHLAGRVDFVDAGASAPVWLWMAQRRPDGSDPVELVRGVTVLKSDELIGSVGPVVAKAPRGDRRGACGFDLPLPADPTLAGQLYLWQYLAVAPSGRAIVSDVFGAQLLPGPGDSGPAQTGQRGVDSPADLAERAARFAHNRAVLRGSGILPGSADDVQRLRKLLAED